MAYRKIMIAVDCDTDAEQQKVQNIAQDLSETLRLKAKDLINFYPTLQQNKGLLYTAIKTISQDGKKGLFKLVPLLMKQM